MTYCEQLSDRMPEVASGRSAWTPGEGAHLDDCPDCQAEWSLVRATSALGGERGTAVDSERIEAAVLSRLRQIRAEPVRPGQRWLRRLALPAAAAAVLVLGVWFGGVGPSSVSADPAVAVLHELDDLTAAELESLFAEVNEADAGLFPSVETPGTFADLSDTELEALLRIMEG